jgi:hypothetical protein
MHPAGQLIDEHWPVAHVDLQEQESAQSTSPHALIPLHVTVHAASLQLTSSHALVPLHVTSHAVFPFPQSIAPHALLAVQLISQERAFEQSMSLHDPLELQLIVQSNPDGQSTPPHPWPC